MSGYYLECNSSDGSVTKIKNKKMNDISSDESTDEEEINKNFETEAQLIIETDTLLLYTLKV